MVDSMSHTESLFRQGHKDKAAEEWERTLSPDEEHNVTAKIKAHAGLAMYYQEKGNKKKSSDHLFWAMEKTPYESDDPITYASINGKAYGAYYAKEGELDEAESGLKMAAHIYECIEQKNSGSSKKANFLRGETGIDLVSLVYLPQEKPEKALKELEEEVIPRIRPSSHLRRNFGWSQRAEIDLADAYHLVSVSYDKIAEKSDDLQMAELALDFESKSLALWKKHPDYLNRVETAEMNIQTLKEKYSTALEAVGKDSSKHTRPYQPR